MNFKYFFLLFLGMVCCCACKDTNPVESDDNNRTTIDRTAVATPKTKTITVYAWVDKLRMREAPDTDADIIAEIPEGGSMTYLEEKTAFTQQFTLRGKQYDEPWLKVKSVSGKTGWVYGGGVKFYQPKLAATPTPYDGCMDYYKRRRISQANSCFKRIEKKQLRKDKAHVQQADEGVLIFTLLSGKKVTLDDTAADRDSLRQHYTYRYYLPQMSVFVVESDSKFSDHRYRLINDKSGRVTPIWGFPAASPDYKHLLSANAALKSGTGANGIQLLGYTDKGLEVVWEEKMTDYEPIIIKWLDVEEAEVTLLPKNSLKLKIGKLEKGEDGSWELAVR